MLSVASSAPLRPEAAPRVIRGLTQASRCNPLWPSQRGSNPAARIGLRYERALERALRTTASIEYQPWFTFSDAQGIGYCAPDFLLRYAGRLFVVETKLTYKPEALQKLNALYIPVVMMALGLTTRPRPLVICKNLTRGAPSTALCLQDIIDGHSHIILQWRDGTPFPWH